MQRFVNQRLLPTSSRSHNVSFSALTTLLSGNAENSPLDFHCQRESATVPIELDLQLGRQMF
jgi:hypothetical protein